MNKFLLINIKPIFFLAIFSLSSISIAKEVNELLEKHGRMYEPGVEEPYTGKYILYHENGNKRYEGNFSIGKMEDRSRFSRQQRGEGMEMEGGEMEID